LKDWLLGLIEHWSAKMNSWAWDRRWKHRDKDEWLKGYREWKKKQCPHN